jgi:alpha-tubulin suppressor-like RCC1 family protein
VRVRRVCAGDYAAFAVGEDGEVFSWGRGPDTVLGHGDMQSQPSPKRVEALRGIRVSSVSAGWHHVLALAEDGLVYAWGANDERATLGDPLVERQLLPEPVEVLRGVRVASIAAAGRRTYALAGTGEVWAWGIDNKYTARLGHAEEVNCLLPKPIETLRGIKVDAVAAGEGHTLAVADDRSVYTWGCAAAAISGALGLGSSVSDARSRVPTPQRVLELRAARAACVRVGCS